MSQKNSLSISENIAKLDKLVEWFEGEAFELEEALEKFTEAELLAKEIDSSLNEFKAKLTVIKKDFSSKK